VAALEEYYLSRPPVREQPARLAAIGPERLRLMDEAGITVLSGPGAELLPSN